MIGQILLTVSLCSFVSLEYVFKIQMVARVTEGLSDQRVPKSKGDRRKLCPTG